MGKVKYKTLSFRYCNYIHRSIFNVGKQIPLLLLALDCPISNQDLYQVAGH